MINLFSTNIGSVPKRSKSLDSKILPLYGSINLRYPLLENNDNLLSIKKGPLKLIFLISLK